MRARLLPLLALCACDGAGSAGFVSLDGIDFERAQVVVVVDTDGPVVRVGPPMSRTSGGELLGGPTRLNLPPGGRAYLVTLEDSTLAALEPRWLGSAPDAFSLVAPDAPRLTTDDALVLRDHPLPAGARVHPLARASASFLEPSTVRAEGLDRLLTLRLRREPCRPASLSTFAPWHVDGPRPFSWEPGEDGTALALLRVDDRRVLVVDALGLFLVDRDRPVEPARTGRTGRFIPRAALVPPPDGAQVWYVGGAALGAPGADGRRELLVSVESSGPSDGDDRGAIARAWLGPDGLEVDAGGPLLAPPVHLSGVALDGEGRAVAAGSDGSMRLRPGPEGVFGEPTFPGSVRRRFRAIASASSDADAPLLAVTSDHLHRWRPAFGDWTTQEIPRAVLGRSFGGQAVRADEGGTSEVWLAGQFGALAIAGPREIVPLPPPRLPLSFASCGGASVGDGQVTNGLDWLDVELAGAHAVLAAASCPGMVFLRRDDGCAHFEPVPHTRAGTVPRVIDAEVRRGADGRAEVLALTHDGELWIATWEDPR